MNTTAQQDAEPSMAKAVHFSFVPPVDEHDVRKMRRPMLVHLNADTTWLLLLPRPKPTDGNSKEGFYRILIDPWFVGPQQEIAGWVSTQEHAIESCVKDIGDLLSAIRTFDGDEGNGIDAVIVSHEFTDHCHRETLMQVSSAVPVFAAGKNAAEMVRSWKHFTTVVEVSTGEEGVEMFEGVRVRRVESAGDAPPTFHCAVVVSFDIDADADSESGSEEECIVYTPHGVFPAALEALTTTTGEYKYGRPLALVHGLHDIRLGVAPYGGLSVRLNLGGGNGAGCMRACRWVKYWVGTHDERKIERGAVSYMMWRRGYTVDEVAEADAEMRGRYVEVGNGEGVVLV
ncbi:hypothetical protein TWF696_002429 [Orbilia brochopaga]|uniref:Uncharacterized protein n=1 Tax=Orbilia brochopaga TaxID=3140254 RepID=A0AAV9U487_9PEZI